MANLDERGEQIRKAVTEAYLETGKALDVPAIAQRLGWSESKVRRVLDEHRGAPDGIAAMQDFRESTKNFVGGGRKVWVYTPAPWYLRELILGLRGAPEESEVNWDRGRLGH